MNTEEFRIKTDAVENNSNYFLTQEHILKSPELYNFIEDTEKGIFPDISKLDRDQKKELVILFYRLFDLMYLFSEENWEQEFGNDELDLMRTYFIEYSHPKDVTYYSIGKAFVFGRSCFDFSETSPDIKSIQEKLQDKNFPSHCLYMYIIEHSDWETNFSILKETTSLTDEMIQELVSVGNFTFYEEVLKQIVTDVNNNSQIEDKNRYLYNYLLAGSYPLLITNDANFCDAEMVYFKRVMKKQKEAIDYLESNKINFYSELDDSIKIRKLIYSKNLNIDTLTQEDVYIMYKFMFDYANGRTENDYVNEYLIKKLSDKNINIINLAYIMECTSFDEPMRPEIEKFFDKGIIDNKFLYENPFIKISDANSICQKLLRTNKITYDSLTKAIKKQAETIRKQTESNKKDTIQTTNYMAWAVWLCIKPLLILLIPVIIIGIAVFLNKILFLD